MRGSGPTPDRPLRILLVEDNPDDAIITSRAAVRALPCEVEVVVDGAAALTRLRGAGREDAGRPDVILLDLHLPGMTGLEVLRALRSEAVYARTPIVMLTNEADDDAAIGACYASGANSYLVKPATGSCFADALRVIGAAAMRARVDPSLPADA